MARDEYLFTSESVTEGHPDKIADQISDAVLDAILRQDPTGRVACETLLTTGLVVVAGEITTSCYVDIPELVRETIKDVGYTRAKFGFDYETCGVIAAIDEQSADIAHGRGQARRRRPGAHVRLRLPRDRGADAAADHARATGSSSASARSAAERRRSTTSGPTARARSSCATWTASRSRWRRSSSPPSTAADVGQDQIRDDIIEHVILPDRPRRPASIRKQGRLPHQSDRPLRHRRADGRHRAHRPQDHRGHLRRLLPARRRRLLRQGPDEGRPLRRCYMARHVAKNIVAAGLAERAQVQVAYAIGVRRAVSIMVETVRHRQGARTPARAARPAALRLHARRASSSTSTCAARSTARRPPTATSGATSPSSRGSGRTAPRTSATTPACDADPSGTRAAGRPAPCAAPPAGQLDAGPRDVGDPVAQMPPGGRVTPLRRSRLGLWLLLGFILRAIGQAVPLYTDWLWFREVGFTHVFTTRLALRGWLFTAARRSPSSSSCAPTCHVAARTAAARRALGAGGPARAARPRDHRAAHPALSCRSCCGDRVLLGRCAAAAHWDTVLGTPTPSRSAESDPLFGHDLGFFVFVLPFWRLLHGWATALVAGTHAADARASTCCSAASCSPRAGRAWPRAPAPICSAAGRAAARCSRRWASGSTASSCSSRRAASSSAPPTPTSTPPCRCSVAGRARGALRGVACVVQMFRPGWRFLVGGARGAGRGRGSSGLGIYPALLQRFRVKPNELVVRAAVHRAQHPDDPAGLRAGPHGREGVPGRRDARRPAALERNEPTIKNIRLWDYRPLLAHLRPAAGDPDLLQVRRRGQRPLHAQRRVPPGHAVAARALLPAPAGPGGTGSTST